MSFSKHLRVQVNELWEKEQSHPFIQEIGDGKLPLTNFQYFMKQDYIFLIEFCKVIAICVAKTEKISDIKFFSSLLNEFSSLLIHPGMENEEISKLWKRYGHLSISKTNLQ